jgi:acetate kinase
LRVLVVNAGSSSLKLSVLDEEHRVVVSESVPSTGGHVDEQALLDIVGRGDPIDAVGHRIVHGGIEFVESVRVDEGVVRRLRALSDLAPLHQPKSLAALDVVTRLLPQVPAVACFDTAFHARMPAAASTYALPAEWRKRWSLRRFGFHGLSHAYAAGRAADLAGVVPDGFRVVTCHLGAGASLAAVESGRSVDTTMGFTPLEGLVMATRSGNVDPGLVLWLEEHTGMPPSEVAATLEHRSGLRGLTGSADMKTVLEAEAAGDVDAALGVAVYVHRVRAGIAAMAAAMGGLDALVFTGGVGERAASIRGRSVDRLAFLGVVLDEAANEAPALDAEIGAAAARVRTFVIEAGEDRQIANDVRAVLG